MSSGVKQGVPLSFFHKVNSQKINTSFETAGKNGLLILTSNDAGGIAGAASPVDATDRVKTYASLEDLLAEWDASSSVAQAAITAYSQGIAPSSVSVGFYTAAGFITPQLQEIYNCFSDFYPVISPDLVDDPRQVEIAAFLAGFGVNHVYSYRTEDVEALVAGDTASIGYQIGAANYNALGSYQDAGTGEYIDAAVAGYIAGRDYDVISGYTLYGTRLSGVSPANINETQLNALQDNNLNANVCVTGPNINQYVSGVLGDGSFVDSCHKLCWLNARIAEAQLAEQLEDGPPRSSREGYQDYIDRYSEPLALAKQRGIIDDYAVNAPLYDDISRSQLASREAVCISADITDNGSIHGSCLQVNFTL